MSNEHHDLWNPGPYTLMNLGHEAFHQAPAIVKNFPGLLSTVVGDQRISLETRLSVHLRFARLSGCPVCVGFFPKLGPLAGLSSETVQGLLNGDSDHLTDEQYGTVVWVEELVKSDGIAPDIIPEPAQILSETQREQLEHIVRLEILIHATGLMFLPHSMIKKAATSA